MLPLAPYICARAGEQPQCAQPRSSSRLPTTFGPGGATMKLTIKDIKTAKVFDVEIAAEPVSVEVLKLAIQASQRIEVANQKLVFKGKTLREGVKLGDVGVERGGTVHFVVRLETASEGGAGAEGRARLT